MIESNCPFTGIHIPEGNQWRVSNRDAIGYSIAVGKHYYSFTIKRRALRGDWNEDSWFRKNKHLVVSAMYNGLALFDEEEVVDLALVKQRVTSSTIPHTPKMKLDNLLRFIEEDVQYPGASVTHLYVGPDPIAEVFSNRIVELYFRNKDEFFSYLETLSFQGFINLGKTYTEYYYGITYKGLSYLASLEEEGSQSNRCFVAMAFSNDRAPYRAAIINSIKKSGYEAIIIDVKHIESDKTINDQIIAEIRKSKFCIADFTLQRNGVYFEAGFALGLGKPIIYICDKDDFNENSHFDLKPFQHILYSEADELEVALTNKIAAWIQ
ncbi:hypothetical protein F1C16_21420 (plasmid) [Hymenobacter sp. NBH84]|uniref:hypothetical protein n=1 Tax=Hymenobacter sp. NBH84 TaxID=2596915 RepID=UPI001624D65C|nr:hypothetical protein [Hymenobacter sp. NBH84]QNE42189.1 hypothetical protein F1C16_21420 [Hymenobacter sp. NBH84]